MFYRFNNHGILWYLRDTTDFGLLLRRSMTIDLTVYIDADWGGCPDTHRSTSSFAVFLGDNLVSWSSKRQPAVSCFSVEVEYCAVANGVAEVTASLAAPGAAQSTDAEHFCLL
jgi:hypothetical protein